MCTRPVTQPVGRVPCCGERLSRCGGGCSLSVTSVSVCATPAHLARRATGYALNTLVDAARLGLNLEVASRVRVRSSPLLRASYTIYQYVTVRCTTITKNPIASSSSSASSGRLSLAEAHLCFQRQRTHSGRPISSHLGRRSDYRGADRACTEYAAASSSAARPIYSSPPRQAGPSPRKHRLYRLELARIDEPTLDASIMISLSLALAQAPARKHGAASMALPASPTRGLCPYRASRWGRSVRLPMRLGRSLLGGAPGEDLDVVPLLDKSMLLRQKLSLNRQ